jgi:hypothetical protein
MLRVYLNNTIIFVLREYSPNRKSALVEHTFSSLKYIKTVRNIQQIYKKLSELPENHCAIQ